MLPRCLIFCTFILSSALGGQAPSSGNLTHFGRNLVVERNQTLHNATCFLCSASVQGHVTGSVHVFAGDAFLDGRIDGNVLVFGGSLSLAAGANIAGTVLIFGGHLHQGSATLANPPTIISALVFLPLVLIVCLLFGGLIVLARRMVRGPVVYPPLPRL